MKDNRKPWNVPVLPRSSWTEPIFVPVGQWPAALSVLWDFIISSPCSSHSQLPHFTSSRLIFTSFSFLSFSSQKDQSGDKASEKETEREGRRKNQPTGDEWRDQTKDIMASWRKRHWWRRRSRIFFFDDDHHHVIVSAFHRFIILETKLTMAEAGWSTSSSANRWLTLSVVLPCFLATNPKSLDEREKNVILH